MLRIRRFIPALVLAAGLQAQPSRQQDLDFVTNQLPKLHVNFFFQLSPADYSQAASLLGSQIPNLTDAEFYVRLQQLVAMAGDEHTTLALNQATGFQQFPLRFEWLDDGVFVTSASTAYRQALGAQLVQVGDTPIDQVVQKLAATIPHSNQQWVRAVGAQYLSVQQILQGLDLVPATATSALTFQDFAGNRFTLQVGTETAGLASMPSAGLGPLPWYLQNSSQYYWFTYSAPLRLVYVKYNVCGQMPGSPFADFANQVLQAMDANPVDTVVIDYRGNGGGDASVISPLVNGLGQRLPAFLGNPAFRAYAIVDKGTFSSAVDDAMSMRTQQMQAAAQLPGAGLENLLVVIGQPTGGAPSGYGEVQRFTLPSGKMAGQYSTKFFPLPPYIPAGPAFAPDVAVPLTSADYFARHDPVLAAVVARWKGAPAAPSGSAIVLNAASYRVEQGIAPGSFASAFGSFGKTPDQVLVNGQPASISAAAATQVNFLVPAATAVGPATFSVRAGGAELAAGQAAITTAGPGIFVLQSLDPAQPGAILNQDSTVNGAAHPAAAGSILQIFATGHCPLDGSQQAAVQVIAGSELAQVLYSGESGVPGLWQINAQLPADLTGQLPVYVIAGNTASNAVTVWVK
ncbi:MAG: hypothetical protein P4L56_28320 [Candidatus Sulfopaludibacter sp.]|nr:hypothetical protein [Candidatus Sulfopaludibacter sp.]